jgi:hypothetical protein
MGVLNISNLQQLVGKLPTEVHSALGAALRAQDKLNLDINNAFTGLSTQKWQTPTLLNGWVPIDSNHIPRFCILSTGQVFIEGTITLGTPSTVVFTLPLGYRIGQDSAFAAESSGAFGKLLVLASGDVKPIVGTSFCITCTFLASTS